jgi:hypothetical protein
VQFVVRREGCIAQPVVSDQQQVFESGTWADT